MDLTEHRDVYTVSRLNGETRIALDISFPGKIWVEGEISNLAKPASGHIYFSLKDQMSQVRCAMFRMNANRINFKPNNGDHVLIHAKVSLYEPRGDFQLVVDHMEPAGEGALLRALEELKQKLAKEGLFEEQHKKTLPNFPKAIGVVTSPSGAAIRDILSVLKRRFAAMPVIIYPTAVQGPEATAQIISAIEAANQRQECDVLIVGRGGGSLEDLWCFNEEAVARAIYTSRLPIISAVGHEIDFTISDLVADLRAPTPSAAAELATPDATEIIQRLNTKQVRLSQFIFNQIKKHQQSLTHLSARLQQQHPKTQLEQKCQRLDEIEQRLLNVQRRLNEHRRIYLSELNSRLHRHSPQQTLNQLKTQHVMLDHRLKQVTKNLIASKKQQMGSLIKTLEAVSPLATLSRGYSILSDDHGKTITKNKQVKSGDTVVAKLHEGKLVCTVKESH